MSADKEFLLKALITKICSERQILDLKYEQEFFADQYKLFKKVTERKADIPSLEHLRTKYKFEPVSTELTLTDIREQLDSLYFVERSNKVIKDLLAARKGADETETLTALDNLQKEFNKIRSNITKSEIIDIFNEKDKLADEYEERCNGIVKVPTGFKLFDEVIAPEIGHLAILAMPTKRGKSTVMTKMFLHAIRNNIPALYVSLEMSTIQMMNRLIAAAGLAKHNDLKSGKISKEEYKELISKLGNVSTQLLTTTIESKISVATIEKYVAEKKPKVVFVDYLTLLRDADFTWSAATPPTVQLKQLAQTQDCLVWTAVQTDVNTMASEDMVPGPENIRGNKGWVFDADVMVGGTSTRFLSDPSKFRFMFETKLHRHGDLVDFNCIANLETGDWYDNGDL